MPDTGWRDMSSPDVIAFSVYESYLQPVLLGSIGGLLSRAGIGHRLVDLSVDAMDLADVMAAKAFVITVPLFDSLPAAALLARKLRLLKPGAAIFFTGAHATLNCPRLETEYGGTVVADPRTELAEKLAAAGVPAGPAWPEVETAPDGVDRTRLPPVTAYSYPGGLLGDKTIANVETTSGCRFSCTHCTVFTLSRQHVAYRDVAGVMAEIGSLVDQGADHVTFMDAEFMNNDEHGPAIVAALHRQFPSLTFDVVSRVDRILKYEAEFLRFFDAGCAFVTTAIEFPDDNLLQILRKGYRTKDLARLSELVATTGMRVNPTLIVFSPWVDVKGIEAGEAFLRDAGLTQIIDPVQYQTRLMLTKGSPLLDGKALDGVRLIEREFSFDGVHPDPATDALYRERIDAPDQDDGFKRCCIRC